MSTIDEAAYFQQYQSQLSEDVLRYLSESDCRRFLRARKWNVAKALEMTGAWWTWYNAPIEGTDNVCPRSILDSIEDPNEDIYQKMLPHSNFGFSRDGCPIYWEKTGKISSNFNEISKKLSLNDLVIRHIRQQEMAVRRMQYYNDLHGTNVEQQVIVFNLADLSYSLNTTALSAFRKTLQIDQDYYPETLHTMFMINAPWFFTGLWAVISPWIDPVTANKIRIVGSDFLPSLREVVADDQIPQELGGSCPDMQWEWPFPEHTGCSAATLKLPLKNELKYAGAAKSAEDEKVEVVSTEDAALTAK